MQNVGSTDEHNLHGGRGTIFGRSRLAKAWRRADALEEAWLVELRLAFGCDADERRYDKQKKSHPRACRKAWRRAIAARHKYWAAYFA
jgi:hypothetical protein